MRLVPAALVCAAALCGALVLGPPAAGGATPALKVATPLIRTYTTEPGQGSVTIAQKGTKVSVTFAVAKVPPSVAAPLGVFVENGVGDGTFTQVGSIAALKKGAGKLVLASATEVPPALGVSSLDELVGRRVEIRNTSGGPLLRATVPVLAKFEGTKLSASIVAVPGSPAPKAAAKVTAAPSASKGTEKFVVKTKGLAPGAAYSLFVEDAVGSAALVDAGALVGGVYTRDTARGDFLPLGVATVADLLGRAIQVRDTSGTPVVGGTMFFTTPDGTIWPFAGVVIMDIAGTDDYYLGLVGNSGPIYRRNFDGTDAVLADLKIDPDAVWSFRPAGVTSDGSLCTVRNTDDPRIAWTVYETATPLGMQQLYLAAYRVKETEPTPDEAKFILHRKASTGGHTTFTLESLRYRGKSFVDLGHTLTGNGVLLVNGPGLKLVLR